MGPIVAGANPEGIAASLLVTMGDGWRWRKPDSAALSVLAAEATARLQLLYPPPPAPRSGGDQQPARVGPIEAREDYPHISFY